MQPKKPNYILEQLVNQIMILWSLNYSLQYNIYSLLAAGLQLAATQNTVCWTTEYNPLECILQSADCNLFVDKGIHITVYREGTCYSMQTVICL